MSEATQAGERLLTPIPTRGMTVLSKEKAVDRQTSERPTEPGLWEREGKFYIVQFHDGYPCCQDVQCDGRLGASWYASKFPGNWRKLTAKPATPSTPKVIEGKGQAVTEPGWYAIEDSVGDIEVEHVCADTKFKNEHRYVLLPLPAFPPRQSFTAPPKPEPIKIIIDHTLYRTDDNVDVWIRNDDGVPVYWKKIDPTTGKVIKGG